VTVTVIVIVMIPAYVAIPVAVGLAVPRGTRMASAVAHRIDTHPHLPSSVAHLLVLHLKKNVARLLIKARTHRTPRKPMITKRKMLIWWVIEREKRTSL
jgi:hypothetical protein